MFRHTDPYINSGIDMHEQARPELKSNAIAEIIAKTVSSLSSDILKIRLQRNNMITCLKDVTDE